MRTYFVIIEPVTLYRFRVVKRKTNQVELFCVMLLRVTRTTLRPELDPWMLQGRRNAACLTSKRGDDEQEPFATWTPPFAHEYLKITRVQRAKTFISYLLLFFGFRARRSFRWFPAVRPTFPLPHGWPLLTIELVPNIHRHIPLHFIRVDPCLSC